MMQAVFDGHNDILLRLQMAPKRRAAIWLEGEGRGHLDLPRMRAGGFAGGMFAIYIPNAPVPGGVDYDALMDNPPYEIELPAMIPQPLALPVAVSMASHLMWMARASDGAFRLCHTAGEIEAARTDGAIAAVMHMEGAEALDEGLDALYAFHAMGLRSLGPVWSRPTIFGHGVPFRFPAGPDTGPGLTDAGRRLIGVCNELRLLIDLSHLNEAGFNDVAALSDAPLVATHSNAHAVTPSTRNLTDRQLDMIRESGGMVGLNFGTVFLNPDGRRDPTTGWGPVLRHLDHLIGRLGEDHVGFGSDFDGVEIPEVIGDVAGLPALIGALRTHGYDQALIDKLAWSNWINVLRRTWGA